MAILKPDKTSTLNGVKVNEYLLTKHNPNKISMPTVSMKNKVIGITVHNTDWIKVADTTTPAEQYTRATINGNMNDVRVHYYVDHKCAWKNLPHDLIGWHAADGSGNGNRKTIAIECIMSSKYNDNDKASEDNCARLAAYLLYNYGLGIDHLYTHTHWLNVKNGKKGTVDQLNVMYNSYKNCPAYIIPHWTKFKDKVKGYLDELNGKKADTKPASTQSTTKPSTPATSTVSKPATPSLPTYKVGGVYTLQTNVKVRTGAGTKYAQKKRSQLTENGKRNAQLGIYAVLKKDTKVTILETKIVNNAEIWGRIPSGWIALYYNKEKYVK